VIRITEQTHGEIRRVILFLGSIIMAPKDVIEVLQDKYNIPYEAGRCMRCEY
jgi:hypothetical protein